MTHYFYVIDFSSQTKNFESIVNWNKIKQILYFTRNLT